MLRLVLDVLIPEPRLITDRGTLMVNLGDLGCWNARFLRSTSALVIALCCIDGCVSSGRDPSIGRVPQLPESMSTQSASGEKKVLLDQLQQMAAEDARAAQR